MSKQTDPHHSQCSTMTEHASAVSSSAADSPAENRSDAISDIGFRRRGLARTRLLPARFSTVLIMASLICCANMNGCTTPPPPGRAYSAFAIPTDWVPGDWVANVRHETMSTPDGSRTRDVLALVILEGPAPPSDDTVWGSSAWPVLLDREGALLDSDQVEDGVTIRVRGVMEPARRHLAMRGTPQKKRLRLDRFPEPISRQNDAMNQRSSPTGYVIRVYRLEVMDE